MENHFLHQSVGSLFTEVDGQVDLVKFNLLEVDLQRSFARTEQEGCQRDMLDI